MLFFIPQLVFFFAYMNLPSKQEFRREAEGTSSPHPN